MNICIFNHYRYNTFGISALIPFVFYFICSSVNASTTISPGYLFVDDGNEIVAAQKISILLLTSQKGTTVLDWQWRDITEATQNGLDCQVHDQVIALGTNSTDFIKSMTSFFGGDLLTSADLAEFREVQIQAGLVSADVDYYSEIFEASVEFSEDLYFMSQSVSESNETAIQETIVAYYEKLEQVLIEVPQMVCRTAFPQVGDFIISVSVQLPDSSVVNIEKLIQVK